MIKAAGVAAAAYALVFASAASAATELAGAGVTAAPTDQAVATAVLPTGLAATTAGERTLLAVSTMAWPMGQTVSDYALCGYGGGPDNGRTDVLGVRDDCKNRRSWRNQSQRRRWNRLRRQLRMEQVTE